MTEPEHLAVARQLAAMAEQLYQDGYDVIAAELFWGATSRVLSALAIQHGLAAGNQQPRRGQVVHHLVSSHQAGIILHNRLDVAGELHGHFYNSHLTLDEVAERVAAVRVFIADLLNLHQQQGRR